MIMTNTFKKEGFVTFFLEKTIAPDYRIYKKYQVLLTSSKGKHHTFLLV